MSFKYILQILFGNLPMLKIHGVVYVNKVRRYRLLQDSIDYNADYEIEANTDIETYILSSAATDNKIEIGGMLSGTNVTYIKLKKEEEGDGVTVDVKDLCSNCSQLQTVNYDSSLNLENLEEITNNENVQITSTNYNSLEENDKKTYKAAFVVFLVLFILVFIASGVLAFFLVQGKSPNYNNAKYTTEETYNK